MIIKNIYKEIEKEYDEKRNRAKQITEERKAYIYTNFPEIEQIDRTINILGILTVYHVTKRKAPMSIVKGFPQAYLNFNKEEIDNEIMRLRKQRAFILEKAGYSSDYIENAFSCKKCADTGFVMQNGIETACNCQKNILAAKLKKAAGIPQTDVFCKFDSSFYPDKPDVEKYGISVAPRVQMEAVFKRCVRFVECFENPDVSNMVFLGSSGLGKTFLGNCIINALTDKGISCLYMPATSLFKPFAPGFYSQEESNEIIDFILNCSFLLIDDLGSEKQTATRYGELLEILNTRELKGKKEPCKTIITTNLSPSNLFDYYGERVASRILGGYDILKFAGEDIRLKQKNM